MGLMSHDLPRLERLYVDLWMVDIMTSLPSAPTLRRLNALVEIQVPAYIVSYLDAPHLKRATLSITLPGDKAIVNAQLPKWPELEDLVLETSWMKDATKASKAIRGIIRSLTPSMHSSSAPACPALSRLGITHRRVSFKAWLAGDIDIEEDDDDFEQPAEDWSKAPVIGFDLFLLASRRRNLSTQLDSDEAKKCCPLETLRVLNYVVDPMAWGLIAQDWKE